MYLMDVVVDMVVVDVFVSFVVVVVVCNLSHIPNEFSGLYTQ